MIRSALIVDDNPSELRLAEISLTNSKLFNQIHKATDGLEALNFMLQFSVDPPPVEIQCPELVFLDLQMPIMDGFEMMEAFRKIHQLPCYENTAFVICTHSDKSDDRKRALSFPFVKLFFRKPYSPLKVKDMIKGLVSSRSKVRQPGSSYTSY